MAIQISAVTATILAGGTTSEAISCTGTLCGIQLPSNWVTSTITFLVSLDGTNYSAVVDTTATAIGVSSVAASKYIAIPASQTDGWMRFKIVAGSAQTSTDKVLYLSMASFN